MRINSGGEKLVTDELLVIKVLSGEREAFDILIKKYQGIIYNYIFKTTLSKEDSEDIIQEVFIKAYENLYRLESKDKFYSWIFKITVNTMNTHLKRKKHYTSVEDEIFLNIQCETKNTPEAILEIKEDNVELLNKLSVLSDEQKHAMILKYVQGFTNKEIGEILGIKEETVKTKLFRAKKKLFQLNKKMFNKGGVANEM